LVIVSSEFAVNYFAKSASIENSARGAVYTFYHNHTRNPISATSAVQVKTQHAKTWKAKSVFCLKTHPKQSDIFHRIFVRVSNHILPMKRAIGEKMGERRQSIQPRDVLRKALTTIEFDWDWHQRPEGFAALNGVNQSYMTL